MNRTTTSLGGRVLNALLALVLIVGLMPAFAASPAKAYADDVPWEGSGTADDPYQISDAAGLVALSVQSNQNAVSGQQELYSGIYFLQTADIDLTGIEFTEICSFDKFAGTYDGGGHQVTGIHIDGSKVPTGDINVKYLGFFGIVKDATIQNLSLSGGIVLNGDGAAAVGYSQNLTMTNVYCDIDITLAESGNIMFGIGGLVGAALDWHLSDCEYAGVISLGSSVKWSASGLIGAAMCGPNEDNSMQRCAFSGEMSGTVQGEEAYVSAFGCDLGTDCSVPLSQAPVNCFSTGSLNVAGASLGASQDIKYYCDENWCTYGVTGGLDDNWNPISPYSRPELPAMSRCYRVSGEGFGTLDADGSVLKSAAFLETLGSNWIAGEDGYPTLKISQKAAPAPTASVNVTAADDLQVGGTVTADIVVT